MEHHIKNALYDGYPEWYRELFKTSKGEEMNLTLKTRITRYCFD